uniref:Uncharacterized protein n=1 Tax=Rhizophora mucronata TaxID=61149 RepID=A0A2P2PJ83_RHIMU
MWKMIGQVHKNIYLTKAESSNRNIFYQRDIEKMIFYQCGI